MTTYLSILRLVWPLALGMVNNAVMQFVDRAYLAHDSMRALEAVLPAGLLMWIFAGAFQSVVGYSSVFVGQFHGAGETEKCRETCRVALLLALVAGFLSLPLVGLGSWILSLTASSPHLLADERSYFTIMMGGSFFVYAQMASASYFTGCGRTRIVFWVNLAGNLLNIALDPILIFGWCGAPHMGIAGAALATVVSMAVQAVVLFAFAQAELGRWHIFGTVREKWGLAMRMLRFGVPSGLYTVLNMLSFTIFVFVTGGVGDLEMAVSNACFTVNYLLFAPMEGFSIGAATLVAQAIGRGDFAEAERAARRTTLLGVGVVTVPSVLVILFARPVLNLFASGAGTESSEFQALGFTLLLLMAAWQVFDAAEIILSGALKGVGDTKFVMWWMLLSAFILWLPMVFGVRAVHNTMPALWSTMIVYVLVVFVGSVIRWRCGRWKEISLTS